MEVDKTRDLSFECVGVGGYIYYNAKAVKVGVKQEELKLERFHSILSKV